MYLECIWSVLGVYLSVLGVYLESGVCLECTWGVLGVCLECAWSVLGALGVCLACTWVFGA